jgi:hypothetical protein
MERPPWSEVVRHGRALPTLVLSLAIGLHAIDVFVISTVMPAIVAEIGGAGFYAWATMVYMVASIVGAASAAPLSTRLGPRRGYVMAGLLFLAGSAGCGLSPTMLFLLLARTVQGFGGGLLLSLSMALIGTLYPGPLRTRILALVSGVWGVAALLGPQVGGVFSELGWWRGAFLFTLPIIAGFTIVAWRAIPAHAGAASPASFPWSRLALLTGGVILVGIASHLESLAAQSGILALAVVAVGSTFRLDADAANPLFPSHPLSLSRPVGIANWMFFLQAVTHTAVNVLLPLTLQVVHGTPPLIAGYMIAVLALSWTFGSFLAAGLRRGAVNLALAGGQGLAAIGMIGLALGVVGLPLAAIGFFCALVGLGIGVCNLHLTSRTMHLARSGEESLTASSIPTVRSLGVAFGAAITGLLANAAGLDRGIGGPTVAAAVTLVDSVATVAPILAFLLALRLIQVGPAEPAG